MDMEKSIGIYRKACTLEPMRREGHYNLGNSLLHTDRYFEALKSYKRALRAFPTHASGVRVLARPAPSVATVPSRFC